LSQYPVGQYNQPYLIEAARYSFTENVQRSDGGGADSPTRWRLTDTWKRGDHVEAITRAGLEIGTLVLMVGDLAKMAKAGQIADAAKAGKVVKVAGTATKTEQAVQVSQVVTKSGKTVKEFSTIGANGVKIKARSLRKLFLGKTPGKNSETGRKVIERMKQEGKIRTNPETGNTEFKALDEKWYDIKDADMAHYPKDAVSWWNETGRNYGARSPEGIDWMQNSDNYVLDHFSNNRSAGARLDERYLPPSH
jgi:hypothetical protein